MATSRTASLAKVVSASPLLAVLGRTREAQLSPRGELGPAETSALCDRGLALSAEGFVQITVDLTRVVHWDYRCLPRLARLSQRLRARGGALRLVSPSRYLATVLRFGGLEDLVVELPARAPSALASRGLGA